MADSDRPDGDGREQAASLGAGGAGKDEPSHGPPPPDSAETIAALAALSAALRHATDALRDETKRSPADALLAFAAADRALEHAPGFLAALRPLVEIGEPADVVVEELARHEEQFADLERQTIPLRRQLSTLLESAEQFRAEVDKRDEIERRIEELRSIEQLAAGVAELRAQADALEARTAAAALAAADADARLSTAGSQFITLSSELLAALDSGTRELLLRADEQDRRLQERLAAQRATAKRKAADAGRLQQELAAADREAAEAEARFDELHASINGRLEALRRYAASDREISDSLSSRQAEQGTGSDAEPRSDAAILDQIEKQLADVDADLARKLAEHQRLRAAAMVPLRLAMAVHPPTGEEE